MIVFPGGGYYLLDIETHATALAEKLGPLGIAVFALKYRCGDGATDVPAAALLDAQQALRLVRANAAEWGVDPERVGAAGYSAGSHLVLNLASHFDEGNASAANIVDQQSSRPAFVASLSSWSYGESQSSFTFLSTTPAVFLAHAEDDDGAPIALARDVQTKLEALDVPTELLVLPTGGHSAFHVGDESATGRNWTDEFVPWLMDQSILR
jgi:acetyl esterase/lipase